MSNPKETRSSESKPENILGRIISHTEIQVAQRQRTVSEETLSRRAQAMEKAKDFPAAVRRDKPAGQPKIIAEIKKASPSKGVIRENFSPLELARELGDSGADALSVLTEKDFFQGSPRYLRLLSDNLHLPLLCKDFIISQYQVFEARLNGADAILLIVAALSPAKLYSLARLARDIGLAVLAEVHTQEELEVALRCEPPMIGVNSRDLRTFETDLQRTAEILGDIPDSFVRVAESGISRPEELRQLSQAGADAFLIGETLMRSPTPGQQLRQLKYGTGS